MDRSNYVAVWSYDPDKQEAVVSMGARIMDMPGEGGMGEKDDHQDPDKMDMTEDSVSTFSNPRILAMIMNQL